MSILFDQTAHSTRPRAVSNGGLGGFVQLEPLIWDQSHGSKSTWPRRRKQRPPPIDLGIEGSLLLTTVASTAFIIQGCRTPVTPGTPWAMKTANPAVRAMTPARASPPVSRYSVTGRARVYASMPETPATPESNPSVQPVELPGSLLLPSQGFPQSEPPVTPSRQTFGRSYSDESSSTLCSTPGLSTCSTATAAEMDVLRSFSPKKKPTKSTTSSASTHSVHKIGKPFSAMTAEELIQCLPECSSTMIVNTWVPAMLREYQKIKKLLQDASDVQMDTNTELRDFGAEIESISNDARKISTTYEHALLRAESLSERDIKAIQEKLENAEADLCEALAAIDGQRDNISEKEEVIRALQHNSDAIVHILGAFIEDTLPHSVHSLEAERVHEVMQLLSDYSPSTGGQRSPLQLLSPFLRIPESTFHTHIQNLRDIQAKVQSYRELAQGQNNLITSQSADLDQRVIEYEKCLKTIKERDHEILLLVEQNHAQTRIIEEYEAGMKVSEVAKIEQETLVKQRQNMERTIKNLKIDHAKQIEDRDAEIDNLRQKLGDAWEEVLARKADVKNVISQTQALLAPPELHEMGPATLSPKERKMLGKNKPKIGALPSSRSMLSLSMSEATLGFGKLDIPAAPLSAVECITHENKPKPHMEPRSPRVDDEGWNCGIARKRGSFPNLRRAFGAVEDLRPRPRNDSLGAVSHDRRDSDLELLETIIKGSVDEISTANSIDTEKELPAPPEVHSEYGSIHNSDGGHSVTEEILHDLLLPEVPEHSYGTPLSPRKRVLSGIPEMSESQRSSPSATSSDKEVYRKSIDALNLIEFMRESDMRKSAAVPDYEGNDYGPVELGVADEVRLGRNSRSPTKLQNDMTGFQTRESPEKTDSQMYHAAKSSMKK